MNHSPIHKLKEKYMFACMQTECTWLCAVSFMTQVVTLLEDVGVIPSRSCTHQYLLHRYDQSDNKHRTVVVLQNVSSKTMTTIIMT